MFGIGFSELVVIGLILIIAVGPNRMPTMLRAVVKAYREFRNATRDLRASTGIDDLLRDEDLRSLRKPFDDAPVSKPASVPRKRSLTIAERAQEFPPEGVDVAEALDAEQRPPAADPGTEKAREREIINAKLVAAGMAPQLADEASEQALIDAKLAAAGMTPQDEPTDAEAIRAAKITAAEREDEPDVEAIRAAKIAAAEREAADARSMERAKTMGAASPQGEE